MRKWTKSACVVIAWTILALAAVVSSHGPTHPVQAASSIASSSTQQDPAPQPATLTSFVAAPLATAPVTTWTVRPGDTLSAIAAALSVRGGWQALYTANRAVIGPDPNVLRTGITLTLTGKTRPASYEVGPGDTLSAIAAALAVPGGWQTLYAANRRAIGPDPNLLRTGTTLNIPQRAVARPAPPATQPGSGGSQSSSPARHPRPATTPTPPGASKPAPAPSTTTAGPGVMPVWVKATLLAAGLLTLIAFLVEAALLIGRRRRPAAKTATPPGPPAVHVPSQSPAEHITKIIQASHERLIVTYSVQEDTVYLLTPPGEDPQSILRAARLIMPENTYEELAEHLGVPSVWRE